MKNRILSFIVFILVSGCSSAQYESNILEDISKENYTIFVESYELYEERVETTNGQFVDAYGGLIDFNGDGDVFADSDLLETAGEHCEKLENDEEGILTEIGISSSMTFFRYTSLSSLTL